MYKITQQLGKNGTPIQKYTLECFYFSKETHTNKKVYSVQNMDKPILEKFLNGEGVNKVDVDFAMIVLKSNGSPTILTDNGLFTTPVRRGERYAV